MKISRPPRYLLVNAHSERIHQVWEQKWGYQSGKALRNHIDTCHSGKFDENCRACREIGEKQEQS